MSQYVSPFLPFLHSTNLEATCVSPDGGGLDPSSLNRKEPMPVHMAFYEQEINLCCVNPVKSPG